MRTIYRLLSVLGDLKAASRGPSSLARRIFRRSAHRSLAQAMRRGGF